MRKKFYYSEYDEKYFKDYVLKYINIQNIIIPNDWNFSKVKIKKQYLKTLRKFIKKQKKIEHLIFNHGAANSFNDIIKEHHNTSITGISCDGNGYCSNNSGYIDDDTLLFISNNFPNLKILDITRCDCNSTLDPIECEVWNNLLSSHKQLETIDFYCMAITDKSLIIIANNCNNLKKLNLRGCVDITDIGVLEICNKCTLLQTLIIGDNTIMYPEEYRPSKNFLNKISKRSTPLTIIQYKRGVRVEKLNDDYILEDKKLEHYIYINKHGTQCIRTTLIKQETQDYD